MAHVNSLGNNEKHKMLKRSDSDTSITTFVGIKKERNENLIICTYKMYLFCVLLSLRAIFDLSKQASLSCE